MASKFASTRLHGDKELKKALQALSVKTQNKITMIAAMAGASPILQAARAKAPSETGLLSKSIKARKGKRKIKGSALIMVGPTMMKRAFRRTKKGKLRGIGKKALLTYEGKVEYRNPGRYGWLVEMGHAEVRPKHKQALAIGGDLSKKASMVPARPFMRPAFLANSSVAIRKMFDRAWQEIAKESRRQAARGPK